MATRKGRSNVEATHIRFKWMYNASLNPEDGMRISSPLDEIIQVVRALNIRTRVNR